VCSILDRYHPVHLLAVTTEEANSGFDAGLLIGSSAAAVPPVITGAAANQAVSDNTTIDPFANVTVTDPNIGQTETATVTPSNTANGTLSDPYAASDGSTITNGVYMVTGTAAVVTADLDGLVFHPVASGSAVTTGFTIAVTNTAGQTTSNAATSVVASAARLVLFDGAVGTSGGGLWVTDGTANGTYELTGISGANSNGVAGDSGFGPSFTVFNNEVLFQRIDTSGNYGLWVTDGTAQGTYEITGIAGTYPGGNVPGQEIIGPPGITPTDITTFNGKAVFEGLNANGDYGLWATDGTAQGTHELTGISGEFINPFTNLGALLGVGEFPDFTAFGNEVLFLGRDDTDPSNGVFGLWATDGTAQGTHEIVGGLTGLDADLDVSNLTVFGNEVLFNGNYGPDGPGLWVTDGTTQGTHEITGISGASPDGLNPRGPTVFNNEVLFEGTDANGNNGLWVTDGTAQGTQELTGIVGASSSGVVWGAAGNPDFTVLNNEVLFTGVDASGLVGLWVTDGTAQGTHELTGISGANPSEGLTPYYLTLSNNEVLFAGLDANNKFGLWETDGTAQGTHEIVSGDSNFGIDPTYLAATPFTAADDNAPCYCRGTLIRTNRGQTRVERLRIGDMVKTVSGRLRPIKWIGRRSYSGRFSLGQKHILPICIKAGALDDNVPRRDLWISPHHAMYLDGVLIEAKDLVNGVSIVQAERVAKVEYFHVELDTHDIIIAEGAPSETFLDDDSRGMFHNAHEYRSLYPNAATGLARYCAPRVEDGYEIEAVRQRIEVRAGLRPAAGEPQIYTLRGYVDLISPCRIAGWAQNPAYSEAPVCLDILASGRLIGQTLANRYREDLERAGIGSGRHSFEFTPPVGFSFVADGLKVRRSLDGTALPLSTTCREQLVLTRKGGTQSRKPRAA
jgi:ELWxxDGT repeat protein